MHLKDKELGLRFYLPVLWTINNICVSQQFAQTGRIMECHSDPPPLHNAVWVLMQYNILSVWKVICFKGFFFFLFIRALIISVIREQQKTSSSDGDGDVLWCVRCLRWRGLYLLMTSDTCYSCVCVSAEKGSWSSELFLCTRIQMLSSAHLGERERALQKQPLNVDQALLCCIIYNHFVKRPFMISALNLSSLGCRSSNWVLHFEFKTL